jgi:glycerophosphoryl diester phosphodiesterase
MSAAICSFPDGGPVEEAMEDSLLLYNLTYEEIKSFDCGRRGNARFPEQRPMPAYKPSLADVVRAVEAYCRDQGRTLPWYNIEIKSDPDWDGVRTPAPDVFARLVVEEIRTLGIGDRAYIQSFDLRPLRAVRQIDSTLITALLVANAKGVDGNIEELGYTPEIYSPNYSLVTKGVVDRVHERGMTIVPWTVNDTLVMQEMIGLGVDGIITDYPNYIEQVEKKMENGL